MAPKDRSAAVAACTEAALLLCGGRTAVEQHSRGGFSAFLVAADFGPRLYVVSYLCCWDSELWNSRPLSALLSAVAGLDGRDTQYAPPPHRVWCTHRAVLYQVYRRGGGAAAGVTQHTLCRPLFFTADFFPSPNNWKQQQEQEASTKQATKTKNKQQQRCLASFISVNSDFHSSSLHYSVLCLLYVYQ